MSANDPKRTFSHQRAEYTRASHLKEYAYKTTGSSGKYEGASGGGTYTYEELTDTLAGGRYKRSMELP
jgi:hypothetical protein